MRLPARPVAIPARRFLSTAVFLALLLPAFLSPSLHAKSSEWKDLAGTKFKGEPVEILGPFALFKTSPTTSRRMLLRGLAPDDILRLHREIASRPARAASWSDAKGAATSELPGRVFLVKDGKLVPADLSTLPEPELLILLFGSHNDGESWFMLRSFTAVYDRIQRVYPGKVGAVFMGVRHSEPEHQRIAVTTAMPWPVAGFAHQNSMNLLGRFTPAEGAHLVLLSRDGVPLLSTRATGLAEIAKFSDDLTHILAATDSANARSWPDRRHYLSLTRPIDFADSSTGPLLLGHPFRADGLRQRGVSRIEARIAVAPDGTAVPELLSSSEIPEPLKAPLLEVLQKQAVFLPAIDRGQPVAGTCDYTFAVPPENPALSADTAWLNGEARTDLPLPSWLVLAPIKVEEMDFANTVERVAEDDTVMLKAVQVSGAKVSRASQMNAFNTDWFTEAGAGTVNPSAGDPQHIDGTTLTWKRTAAPDGLVDFGEHNYSVGYAWTEFDSPAATDAWLGLGSDDGVKIWLNGKLVNDRWIRRMSRLDDEVIPLRLKKGKNRLLVKIQNATGEWSFIARLRTR